MSSFSHKLHRIADAVDQLHDETSDDPPTYITAMNTLITITKNIIKHSDAKYRTLNLQSPALQQKLSRFDSAHLFLSTIGFREADDETQGKKVIILPTEEEDAGVLEMALNILTRSLYNITKQTEKKEKETHMEIQTEPEAEKTNRTDTMEEKDVDTKANSSTDSVASNIESQRERQEREDREYSEALQKEEQERVSASSTSAAAASSSSSLSSSSLSLISPSPPLPSLSPAIQEADLDAASLAALEAERRVNLTSSTYNISDVRKYIRELKQQIQIDEQRRSESDFTKHEAFLASLMLLMKLSTNLLKQSTTTADYLKYRSINLKNELIKTKLARYTAAIDYLIFLGFNRSTTSSSNNSDDADILVLMSADEDHTKIERAATICRLVLEEEKPSEEEVEHHSLGECDRELNVMEFDPTFTNGQTATHGDSSNNNRQSSSYHCASSYLTLCFCMFSL